MLAAQLEQRYTKAQILEEYLNTVYLGEGYYGVEAASRGYFGKPASDLAPHEAALLAALVRSPSNDAPCVGPARALKRRNLVLRLMREQGRISDEAFRVATAARHSGSLAPEACRRRPRQRLEYGPLFPGRSAAPAVRALRGRQGPARRAARLLHLRPGDAARRGDGRHDAHRGNREIAAGRARPAGQPRRDGPGDGRRAARSSAAATSRRAASTAPRRRAVRPARRSSRSSTPPRSSAGIRRAPSCATSTRRSRPATRRRGCRPASTSSPSTRCGARSRSRAIAPPRSCCSRSGSAPPSTTRSGWASSPSFRWCRRWRSGPAKSRCSS